MSIGYKPIGYNKLQYFTGTGKIIFEKCLLIFCSNSID